MAGLKFTVDVNGFDSIKRRLAEACSEAEHTVALHAMKDTRKFVPWRNGMLDDETKVYGNAIVYPGPYAKFLYYGKVMIYPPTGSTWAPANTNKVVTDRNLVFTTDHHPQAQAFWFEASKAQNLDKWLKKAEKAVKDDFRK